MTLIKNWNDNPQLKKMIEICAIKDQKDIQTMNHIINNENINIENMILSFDMINNREYAVNYYPKDDKNIFYEYQRILVKLENFILENEGEI